jgi:hypothetical protein
MRKKQPAKPPLGAEDTLSVYVGRRRSKTSQLARAALVCFSVLLTAAPAFATTFNILLIHGRMHNTKEKYGYFRTDQSGAWGGLRPTTAGTVWYVQWDAWNRHFDDSSSPGGEAIVQNAINHLCDASHGQACWIICHSAGCAAFEDYLAKSNYAHNNILIEHVIAADSAAGGSELADNGVFRYIGGLSGLGGNIDNSLKTSYARGAYNHNNMQSVAVRGIGGATSSYPFSFLISCFFFPRQSGSGLNPNCSRCQYIPIFGTTYSECDDGAVALHSTCGHSRKASFQDCNSRLPPHDDSAGTFVDHGWWINDHVCNGFFKENCNWNGPYAPFGKARWDSSFRTYKNDHSDGKTVAVYEYSYAPAALCP